MGDPLFRQYIERLMNVEVTPLLPPVPGVDLAEYKRTLVERFANPKIGDTLARLCQDASDRMPKFLLPSVAEALASRRPCRLLTLAVAGWFRYLRGVDEQGAPIAIQDPMAETLSARALEGGDDPRPLLGLHSLFGDLARNQDFVAALHDALREVSAHGARATLSGYLAVGDA
jgi:fructuronate reductase/mannitol 2-dehydrogenase